MTLEFHPPFQIPLQGEAQRQSLANLGQTFNNIGNQALQYRQQSIDNQRQQALLDLQKKQGQREQSVFNYEYGDPNYQPNTGGPAMSVEPSGPMPSSSLQQGTNGPQPNPNYQSAQGVASYQQGPGMPVDHTQHFQNWLQMGQPASYDHPDYGGTGQSLGMQPNPFAKVQGAPSYNANDPYGLGINIKQVGAKGYQQAYQSQREAAGGRVLAKSPVAKSMFGNSSPEDLAMFGDKAPDILEKGAELEATKNYRNATLNAMNTRITNEEQKPAQEAAAKMYGEFVTTDTSSSAAKQALSQAQKNPAMFTTALFKVGEALGVKSRNPAMVVQAIAAGDPSLAGSIDEYLAKRGSGRLTPQLLSGLNSMVDNVQQSNQQAFETKAMAHIQQNSKYYGGTDKAQSALFPRYQFGSNTNATPGPSNQTFVKIMQNAQGQKAGYNGTAWVKLP